MPPGPGMHGPTRPAPPPARLADLQAEVASLRGHKDRCERAVLSLLREMLQLRACVQLQDAELKRLQEDLPQEAWAPGKEALEVSRPHPEARLPCSRDPVPSSGPCLCRPGHEAQPPLPPCSSPAPRTRTRCRPWTRGTPPPAPVAQALVGGSGALGKQRLGWDPRASALPPLLVLLR